MRPDTGLRFTWQSNTFMNTETRCMGSAGSVELGRRQRRS